jgi:hypothetical protein
MWYVLQIRYESPQGSRTKLHGCSELAEAQCIFDRLELSYQFNSPVRVKDNQTIKVTQLGLYESFKLSFQEALDAVESGSATLMKEARAVEIDLESS